MALVRSRPELAHSSSATRTSSSAVQPHTCDDHLRRVAGEVALQDLEDAARVLQGGVAWPARLRSQAVISCRVPACELGPESSAWPCMPSSCSMHPVHRRRAGPRLLFRLLRRAGVAPVALARVVVAGLPVAAVAAEQPVEVLGVPEPLLTMVGRVGVVEDVLLEPAVVGEDVVDQPAEEGDVAAGPDPHVHVAQRGGAA